MKEKCQTKIEQPSIQFAGQAGFIITTSRGTKLGIDLYLSDCVERIDGYKRLCPKVLNPSLLDLDFLVATHWHGDHFDYDAIPEIMKSKNTKLIASVDCIALTEDYPSERKVFMSEGDYYKAGDIELNALFCDHGDSAPDAIGLASYFDGFKVLFAGDTSLRIDRIDDLLKHGPFDLAVAPINGMNGNMSEKEAAIFCRELQPTVFIPSHYWMFSEHRGDPELFKEYIAKLRPSQQVYCMCPGEVIQLKRILDR